MGPYSEILWSLIEKQRAKNEDVDKTAVLTKQLPTEFVLDDRKVSKLWDKLSRSIEDERAIQMMLTCLNKDGDGFCTHWPRDVKPSYYQLAKDLNVNDSITNRLKVIDGENVRQWFVKASLWFCRNCPAYRT